MLGEGAFGEVWRAQLKMNCEPNTYNETERTTEVSEIHYIVEKNDR